MAKPITIPNTFASATSAIPLSQLDQDFSTLANATNDLATYSNYVADTGAADAYIANYPANTNTSSLTTGLRLQFKAANANTGASTLNVQVNGGSIGTAAIRLTDGSALPANTIIAGALVDVMYDGTNFQIMNDPSGGQEIISNLTLSGNLTVAGTSTFTGNVTGNVVNTTTSTITNLTSSNVTITGGTISNVTLDNVTVDVETFSNITINGTASFAAGSNTAPSITFTGDTNTGIYSPAADTIAFTEGGAEAMRIDNSGRVGIGTTTPATPLQVNGTITATSLNTNNTFGFKNRIINGAMVIDQRNAGASVSTSSATNGTFQIDRWKTFVAGTAVVTAQQSSTAPTGFINSQSYTVATADTSIAAGDLYVIEQPIEGLNCSDLSFGSASASTMTLSFWVQSSITGTYCGALTNSAENRAYIFTYTISSANTWEQKTVTIAGDTSGTWLTTSGIGIRVRFTLSAGNTFQGTANTWSAANVFATSSQTQWVSTLSATFYITGVQLEVGSTATSFDYRPYGTELALCQRYFYSMGGNSTYEHFSLVSVTGSGATSTDARGMSFMPVPMRTVPSIGQSGSFQAAGGGQSLSGTFSAGTTMYYSISAFGGIQNIGFDFWPGTAGTYSNTNGACYVVRADNSTATRVTFSAEL